MRQLESIKYSILNYVLDYLHTRGLLGHLQFLDFILIQYIKKFNQISFIQIGANDGKSFDPIYKFVTRNHQHIRGIVLEPIKEYYKELKKISALSKYLTCKSCCS